MAKLEPETSWVAVRVIQARGNCVSDEAGSAGSGSKYWDPEYILKVVSKKNYGWFVCR